MQSVCGVFLTVVSFFSSAVPPKISSVTRFGEVLIVYSKNFHYVLNDGADQLCCFVIMYVVTVSYRHALLLLCAVMVFLV
jgi:hypothetical protein